MQNNQNKTKRGGYLLIFFSLVLLMLMVPIWVRTVEQTIIVNQDIKRWDNWSDSMNIARNFSEIYINQEKANGLGSFAFNKSVDLADRLSDDLTEGDDYTFTYDFSGASVIPVPTAYGAISKTNPAIGIDAFLNASSADCHTWSNPYDEDSAPHGAYNGCGFSYSNASKRIEYNPEQTAPADSVNFFYTVPALGTGTAGGSDCQPFRLNLGLNYLNTDGSTYTYVDPLDDPCNWDNLNQEDTVAIPLFIRNPEDPTDLIYPDPNDLKILTLRVRFKCVYGRNVCPPERRMTVNLQEVTSVTGAPISNPSQNDIRTLDDSDKLIDYAIVNQTTGDYYRAQNEYTSDQSSKRNPLTNFEISRNRLRLADTFINNNSKIFKYDSLNKISMVNFVTTTNIEQRNQNIQTIKISETEALSLFEQLDVLINSNSDDALYLVLNFENFPIESEQILQRGETDLTQYRIRTLEYQLISNLPLGNNKFNIRSRVTHPSGKTYFNTQPVSKKPDSRSIPNDTGTVISN